MSFEVKIEKDLETSRTRSSINMASSNTVRIELLNKENYDTWKIQMRALLTKNEAWEYVSGQKPKPQVTDNNAEEVRKWLIEDEKAKADIILSIKPSQLKQIKECGTSHELWLKLQSIYQSSGPARKATLIKQLTYHRMQEGEDVREYIQKFFDTVDRLNGRGYQRRFANCDAAT